MQDDPLKSCRKKSGFTLLELIIVIIIVGVLATLALSSYKDSIQSTICAEALVNLQALEQAMLNCYGFKNSFIGCTLETVPINDPSDSPGAHFEYTITSVYNRYSLQAQRNSLTNGDTNEFMQFLGDRDGKEIWGNIHCPWTKQINFTSSVLDP